MSLTFQSPLWLVIVLALASYAGAALLYRHTVPPVSAPRRFVLTALRGTAMLLLLLALCEPLLRTVWTETRKPAVVLLADRSLSMTQKDGTGDREQQLRALLSGNSLKKLRDRSDLTMLAFDRTAVPVQPESLSVTGGSTDLSAAMRTALSGGTELQGIVLLTDGNYNTGGNPLYDAEKNHVPVFTVGIGDTNEQKDISVARLLMNSIAYAGTAIPVEASLRLSGVPSRSLNVTLKEEGRIVEQKNVSVTASNGVTDLPVSFTYTPATEGTKKLTVSVPAVDGEITLKNNARSALVKVLKSKLAVTVIAGAPSPDVAAVMQTLGEDKNVEAALFYQLPDGTLRPQKVTDDLRALLPKSDAVILIGFPAASTSAPTLQTIGDAVSSRSLPLFFITSRTVDLRKLRSLEHLLPFTVASERMDEQSVLANVPERVRSHQLVKYDGAAWDKLPPIFYSLPTFSAKPEAQTLLGIRIQNVSLNQPLFVIRSVGAVKSAAFLGYGLHRWKVLAGSAAETKDAFTRWFSPLLRWLATREQEKFLTVRPSKEFFSQGEPIGMTAQVYSETYEPLENAEVHVTVRSSAGSGQTEALLAPEGAGIYDGEMAGLPEGEYTYTTSATAGEDTVGRTSGRFSVGEQSVEFTETTMNKRLLQQLAATSGGAYADAAHFPALIDTMLARDAMSVRERERSAEYELWKLPAMLAAMVLLFAIEWFLRKRFGML